MSARRGRKRPQNADMSDDASAHQDEDIPPPEWPLEYDIPEYIAPTESNNHDIAADDDNIGEDGENLVAEQPECEEDDGADNS